MEEIIYKGYTIKIEEDQDPESPREWDNLGKMVCFHNRYSLPMEFAGLDSDNFEGWKEMKEYLVKQGAVIILPLFLYDHSGITMYTIGNTDYRQHEAWDSGQVGFIYATAEDIKKEYSITRITTGIKEKVTAILKGEVETYDQFLTGGVWGYIVEETEDSCWGFYGQEEAIREAKNIVDWKVVDDQRKREAKTKAYIKNNVPLMARV